jgi:hypothetical protein
MRPTSCLPALLPQADGVALASAAIGTTATSVAYERHIASMCYNPSAFFIYWILKRWCFPTDYTARAKVMRPAGAAPAVLPHSSQPGPRLHVRRRPVPARRYQLADDSCWLAADCCWLAADSCWLAADSCWLAADSCQLAVGCRQPPGSLQPACSSAT